MLRQGLRLAGVDVKFGCDVNVDAAASWKINNPEGIVFLMGAEQLINQIEELGLEAWGLPKQGELGVWLSHIRIRVEYYIDVRFEMMSEGSHEPHADVKISGARYGATLPR
eukprot:SAG11_NODE_498_length_8940_cov_11.447121_8_plen_111_part_00